MNEKKSTTQIKALGLCSGGLDSILSAMVLKTQGIDVTWVCFETPFFSSGSAQNASETTGIPLIRVDITEKYMEMMKNPRAGFGRNMNPCMDCHALMFSIAGEMMVQKGFHFLFSGEVVGQRPKSQTKNSLRYVEKNSGFSGKILRPLSAKLMPPTIMEETGLVDREKLYDISGRSRKVQTELAEEFGISEYPSPAGGCLLTDPIFSRKLKDLLQSVENPEKNQLYLLSHGRHFRLDAETRVIAGRNRQDNENIMKYYDHSRDVLIRHDEKPGPTVILTGNISSRNIRTAAGICAAYAKTTPGETGPVRVTRPNPDNPGRADELIEVTAADPEKFKHLMI